MTKKHSLPQLLNSPNFSMVKVSRDWLIPVTYKAVWARPASEHLVPNLVWDALSGYLYQIDIDRQVSH